MLSTVETSDPSLPTTLTLLASFIPAEYLVSCVINKINAIRWELLQLSGVPDMENVVASFGCLLVLACIHDVFPLSVPWG